MFSCPQLGAFVPLMENGGNGEHRPWKFDPPGTSVTVDNYRLFTDAHYELGTFTRRCDDGGKKEEVVGGSTVPPCENGWHAYALDCGCVHAPGVRQYRTC